MLQQNNANIFIRQIMFHNKWQHNDMSFQSSCYSGNLFQHPAKPNQNTIDFYVASQYFFFSSCLKKDANNWLTYMLQQKQSLALVCHGSLSMPSTVLEERFRNSKFANIQNERTIEGKPWSGATFLFACVLNASAYAFLPSLLLHRQYSSHK